MNTGCEDSIDENENNYIIKFTSYDTVKCENDEVTKEDYFNHLEERIKNRKISNFTYNCETNMFSYITTTNKEHYTIQVKNNTHDFRILFSLMKYSNEIDKKVLLENDILKKEKLTEEEMRRKISNDEIDNEQTRLFFIKELKSKLSLKNLLKRSINKFKKTVKVSNHDETDFKLPCHGLLAFCSTILFVGIVMCCISDNLASIYLIKIALPSLFVSSSSIYGILSIKTIYHMNHLILLKH